MPDNVVSTADEVLERLEDEIAFLAEGLATASEQLDELVSNLDDHLVEYSYDRVSDAVDEVGVILGEEVARDLTTLVSLGVIRHGHPITEGGKDASVPTLTAEELPLLVSDDEDDEDDEARIDNLRDRLNAAADHLCLLLSFANDRFDLAREAAERGNSGRALKDLWLAQQAVADAPTAYQLWMRCLGELADVSPGSLGAVGEMLMGFESFLHATHEAGSGNER
ncbi:hypothetical protein [Micromonospora sp. CA-111912]|uniref:hypothetical protein n=1 Tax=Micromonospora sp. CA-111912 TaxID=3239955 RepID=UPI003D94E529